MSRLLRRFRRWGRQSPLLRILLETAALLALHFALVQIFSRVRLLEYLLAPGPGSKLALVATSVFLVFRLFLLVLVPGWLVVRLWLLASRPRPPRHD